MEQYNKLIYIDDLTGVYNRRYLHAVKQGVIPKFINELRNFAITVIDIDHFKEINDTHGHLKGDEVLADFSSYLKETLREGDFIIRYGGDEFVVVQEGLELKNALIIWNDVVKRIEEEKFAGLSISISAGVAAFPEDGKGFDELFLKADDRLYIAKRTGRGRVGQEVSKKVRIPPLEFVNRKSELESLTKGIDRSEICLVKGDAGIGKTRLIRETLRHFTNVEVLWSDCVAVENKIPYYPLRELIKYSVFRYKGEILDPMPAALKIEIGKILPDALEGLTTEDFRTFGEDVDKYRLYEAFNYVFNKTEKKRVIVIDNVQWIDRESIDALKYIMLGNKGQVVFVLAERTGETVEYVESFINGIRRTYSVRKIYLEPFKEDKLRELVRAIVNDKIEKFEDYIVQRSAGNPFYVEELIKNLNAEGYLSTDGKSWVFKTPSKELLPGGIEGVIKEKYGRLSNDAKSLLKILSVAGKGYIGLLKELSGYNEGYVFGLIEETIRSGLVKENIEDDCVEFKYDIAREIIYNTELNEITRAHLHKEVGEWMENNKKAGNEEVIAYHYYVAGDRKKVIEYGEAAGDKVQKLYAENNALSYYDWAEKSLKEEIEVNPSLLKKYAGLLLKKASLLKNIGNFSEAEKFIKKAVTLAKEKGLLEIEKVAGKVLAIIFWKSGRVSDIEEVIALKDGAAIETIPLKDGSTHEKKSDKNFGTFLKKGIGKLGKAVKSYDKEHGLSEKVKEKLKETKIDETKVEKGASKYFQKARQYIGEYEKKVKDAVGSKSGVKKLTYAETSNIAMRIGFRIGEDLSVDNIAVLLAMKGDFNKAEEFLLRSIEVEDIENDLKRLSFVYNNLGVVYRLMGKLKKSLKYMLDAEKISTKIVDKVGEALYKINIANILIDVGSYVAAENLLEEAYNLSLRLELPGLHNEAVRATLKLYEAKNELSKASVLLNNIEMNEYSLMSERDILLMKTHIALISGQFDNALELLERLSGILGRKSPVSVLIKYNFLWLDYYMGVSMKEDAEHVLDEVQYLLKKYPDKNSLALYYRYAGHVYCRDNRVKSLKLFEKSIEIYKEMGLKKIAEKVLQEEKNCYNSGE